MGNKSLRSRPRVLVSSVTLALGAGVAAAVLVVGSAGASSARAKAARTLNLSESANLHLSDQHGFLLKEAGSAKGTLRGPIYIQLKLASQRTVTAKIQVYPSGGSSLSANASASYRVVTSSRASFSGTLNIAGGSGRYSKAKGSGLSFRGTVHRPGDAVSVSVSGKMSY